MNLCLRTAQIQQQFCISKSVEFPALLSDKILFQIFLQKIRIQQRGEEEKTVLFCVFRMTEGIAFYSTSKSPVRGNGTTITVEPIILRQNRLQNCF